MLHAAPDISIAPLTWLQPPALVRSGSASGSPWPGRSLFELLADAQTRDVEVEVNLALRSVALGEIAALGNLQENWDGYGGLPVDQMTVENAKSVIQRLALRLPAPEISPNPNGTISMEWTSPNAQAHLEIGMTRFSFFLKKPAASPLLREGDANDAWIVSSLIEHAILPFRPASKTINSIRMGVTAPA